MPKVSSNPTEYVAIVYLLQIARENDVCKCGRELVGYAIASYTEKRTVTSIKNNYKKLKGK